MEIFGIDAWLAWFLLGIFLLIVEIAIAFTFYAAPISLGSFFASVVAGFDGGIELQLLAFIIGAVASFVGLRPIVREHLKPAPADKLSNVQRLIGRRAIALDRVDIDSGTVRIGDDVWSARTREESVAVEPGGRARVIAVEGVYAYVEPAEREPE